MSDESDTPENVTEMPAPEEAAGEKPKPEVTSDLLRKMDPDALETVLAGIRNQVAFNRLMIWYQFQTAIATAATSDKGALSKLIESFRNWREAEDIRDVLLPDRPGGPMMNLEGMQPAKQRRRLSPMVFGFLLGSSATAAGLILAALLF